MFSSVFIFYVIYIICDIIGQTSGDVGDIETERGRGDRREEDRGIGTPKQRDVKEAGTLKKRDVRLTI